MRHVWIGLRTCFVQRASVVSQPSEAWLGSIDLSVDQPTAQRLSVLGGHSTLLGCTGLPTLNPRALGATVW